MKEVGRGGDRGCGWGCCWAVYARSFHDLFINQFTEWFDWVNKLTSFGSNDSIQHLLTEQKKKWKEIRGCLLADEVLPQQIFN